MHFLLPHNRLDDLLQALHEQGFAVKGPQVRDKTIVYDTLERAADLPWGVRDHQAPGEYQLQDSGNQHHAFDWAMGLNAAKPQLFKPKEHLWKVVRDSAGKLTFQPVIQAEKMALFGIRPCDLKALLIQDKVFISDDYQDQRYKQRRDNLFIVVANCTYSGEHCFCVSAGGYPKADNAFDWAMTETDEGFVVQAGSTAGEQLIQALALAGADLSLVQKADQAIDAAAKAQKKKLPAVDVKKVLLDHPEHPQWDKVAERCLSCGNCTQVCPTCFCHREVEHPGLDGAESVHEREWDSCFSLDHSYIAGGIVRKDIKHRYRQWLTHKFATWHEQFDTSGCVGCGRCISWCPVGIDVTEEIEAISK